MKKISVNNISKLYSTKKVLDSINLDINNGEIHVLLGTNGAGKSTLINIIANLTSTNSGTISYNYDCKENSFSSQDIGFVFEEPIYLPYLSAYEYLEFLANLLDLKKDAYKLRIEEIITSFKIPNDKKPIKEYSKGTKQKVSFAGAILNTPSFLILDEPFDGIDFITTREIIKYLIKLKDAGMGIFITSHQLELIMEIASQFSILHNSRIIMSLSREKLLKVSKSKYPSIEGEVAIKKYIEDIIISNYMKD